MKTPKPLLALRMIFPLAASLIVLLLGEWIARGTLGPDIVANYIFPNIGAYLLAWLLLFLVWLLMMVTTMLVWILRPAADATPAASDTCARSHGRRV